MEQVAAAPVAVEAQAEPAPSSVITGTPDAEKIGGTDGNDLIYGGGGDDALFGGAGDDTLAGGAGDDRLWGGTGADTFRIEAGGGNDTVADFSAKDGDRIEISHKGLTSFDQLDGRIGASGDGTVIKFDDGSTVYLRGVSPDMLTKENVVFTKPSDANLITGTRDDDKLIGTDGNDSIIGNEGRDYLSGGAGDDTLHGGLGDDTLEGGAGADTFRVGPDGGNDRIEDFSAKDGDRIEISHKDLTSFDQLEGRMGWDGDGTVIKFDDGSTVYLRGVSPDMLTKENVVFAKPSDVNLIEGTKEDDKLIGTDARDSIIGNEGRDYLSGGAGNDTLDGGGGDDTLWGGEGADTFHLGAGNDEVGDFSAKDGDRIEISKPGITSFDQIRDRMGGYGDGTVIKFDDGTYTIIHGVPPDALTPDDFTFSPPACFHAGTLILTPDGPRRVESLRPGDLVVTRDRGAQPLLWVTRSTHGPPAPPAQWQPVRIAPHALGPGLPQRALRLSPQHRVMVTDPASGAEVLVAAVKLTGRRGIRVLLGQTRADYVHLLLDRHEVLCAEGAPAESMLVAPATMDKLPPDLATRLADMEPARPIRRSDPGLRPAMRPARPLLPEGQFQPAL